jgi:hypothetical protein
MVTSLRHLQAEYRRICDALGTPRSLATTPTHDGSAHAEVVGNEYHYVVTERGSEFERRKTNDKNELLYWFVADVTHALAGYFELTHRIKGQSFRRLLFQKQIELLEQVNPAWAARRKAEITEILAKHPYDDRIEG